MIFKPHKTGSVAGTPERVGSQLIRISCLSQTQDSTSYLVQFHYVGRITRFYLPQHDHSY
jgi:hypothetical protein